MEKRLAGCVRIIGPIASTYWWKNNIETAEEWLRFVKTEKPILIMRESSSTHLSIYALSQLLGNSWCRIVVEVTPGPKNLIGISLHP